MAQMTISSHEKLPSRREAAAAVAASQRAWAAWAAWLRTHTRAWYEIIVLELILRQRKLPPSKDGRHIPLEITREKALVDERRGHAYISNTIRTSRYTIYDFLPKQLIFQFTRLGNFYFLCVGVPQMIPGLSTTGNYTTILPLMFFVLLTVIKEGYDDYRRHRLDKVENASSAVVLRRHAEGTKQPSWRSTWLPPRLKRRIEPGLERKVDNDENFNGVRWVVTKWSDIRTGDVIRLSRDEPVPADIVLLHADGEDGLAYIETMALDGETNLKSKHVSSALENCSSIEGIAACSAKFVLEDPNPDLYRFDGRVSINGKTTPLTLNDVIYRGSILRNTSLIIGMVINTGEECKIRLNANQHPEAKKPALERVANKIIITLAIYVLALSFGCFGGYLVWQKSTEYFSWYLQAAAVPYHEIIIGYIIQFNNVIPLALYVSLEIVKIGQMIMLNSDVEMYDEESDTPAKCNTNTILENLGQVGYIFSDKTGTLTDNVMKFRKMSIAGTAWLHENDLAGGMLESVEEEEEQEEDEPRAVEQLPSISAQGHTERTPRPSMAPSRPSFVRRSSSHWRSTGRPDHVQPEVTTADLLQFIKLRPRSAFATRAREYLLAMALCHTCLPEVKDGQTEFQAASPDELALVGAAKELGYLVTRRTSQSITLRIASDAESHDVTFDILDVIEFSSKRKRMSVVVRYPDGRISVICKGADSTILPRLKMSHLAFKKATEVRKSVEVDRAALRKSESLEPRNSFGGRPSLSVRRSPGLTLSPSPTLSHSPTTRRHPTLRSQSFEVGSRLRIPISSRALSFETPKQAPSQGPKSPVLAQPLPERFAFLEEPSISDDATVFSNCFKHLDEFAAEGLRTLLFAQKFIDEDEYRAWKEVFHKATTSLVDRQELIEAAGEVIEQSLDLVGASAIEDKLQQGVPETIDKLRRANIRIWMLTGDKRETAINIAHSARICQPASDIFILDEAKGSLESQLLAAAEELQGSSTHSVVVIDGHTLNTVEQSPDLSARFYATMMVADSVICCRASPAQKALLVSAVRARLRGSKGRRNRGLTLAIGDGANDLAMIQASHVGVGISGKEGLQAARVADYAIAKFRFLQRLLLVHGRWNYARTSKFILCTFWKELFFYLPTALYQRYNGYTGTSLYESASLTVFNVLFTSLCVICMGIWEQDLAADTLLGVPELYVYGQRDRGLNLSKYVARMFRAAVDGVLVWFGVWAGYCWFGGMSDQGLFAVGDLAFSAGVMWINWKLFIIETHHKTSIVLICFLITISGWWAWNAFLSGIYAPAPSPYAVRDGFRFTFGPDPVWWLTLLGVFGALALLDVVLKSVRRGLVVAGLWRWPWQERVPGESVEDWDLEVWQELEKDPAVRRRLRGEFNDDEEEDGAWEEGSRSVP